MTGATVAGVPTSRTRCGLRARLALACGLAAPTSLSCMAASAQAPDISITEAHLLATLVSPAAEGPFWVATLEHFSTWRYGSNFFFVDVTGAPDLDFFSEQPGIYAEYAPVVSLGSMGLHARGPLRDVGVTAQLNAGWTPGGHPIDRTFLEGVSLSWSVPGFRVFETQALARQERGSDASWQMTWVYNLPLTAAGKRGTIKGFLDLWRRERPGREAVTIVLAQPQFLLDIGGTPEAPAIQVGVELEPSRNFPAPELSSGWNIAFSPMARFVF